LGVALCVIGAFAAPGALAHVAPAGAAHAAPRAHRGPAAHPVSVTARDRGATRAYVDADYRLVRSARANLHASEAALRALVRQTLAACPLAGEGAFVNKAAEQVSEEVIGTVIAAAYRPDAAAITRFVADVAGLRWSDRRLTRSVRAYAVKLRNLAALAPANLCEDVKTYAAGGFQTAPPATISFDKAFGAADIEAEEVPLKLLAPSEGARQAALLRRAKRLEAPLADAEAKGVERWMEIMRGLGLSV
jgi:hypothetical protein